jgi:PAS domain S-box-containing protein
MTWITILWPMVTGACVTMALIHLRTGLRQRPGAAHLLFSLNAFVVAIFSCLELASTRVGSPAQFLELQRWLDIMGAAMFASLTAFVWVFLGTGRKWLAFLGPVVMCAPLIFDLLPQPKALFLEIPTLRTVETFGGATYTVADGARNPLLGVFYLGVLLILVFVADASVTLWRQGTRRRAAVVGGTITLFVLGAGALGTLVDTGVLQSPYFVSFAYLAIVMAMGAELSNDVLHAAQLARDLRESEARMALAASAANLGLWMWNVPQDKVWATEKLNLMLGFAPGEQITLESFLLRLHPEDRELTRQALQQALKEESDYSAEYRVVLPDGHNLWIAAHGRVERPDANGAVRLLGVCLDITARKHAEAEALQQRTELAHLSRVTMLGELSGSLAHELNQPLTAILSNAQAAQRFLEHDDVDLNELRDILSDIVNQDKRAGEVIHRLRLLLKKGKVEHQPLDLNDVVLEVLKLVRNDLLNQRVTGQMELAADLPAIMGDRVQLQQVVLNLVMNGCDAIACGPAGDAKLIIRTGLIKDEGIRVSVVDHGVGVAPDKLEQVFEPFFSTKPHGMGLGLSVCRTIITAHGGKLWAANNAEHGATFYFTIPAQPELQP